MQPAADLIALRTADGREIIFPSEAQAVLSYGNFGAPPVEYQTRRGYRQDGETVEGYSVNPRPLVLELWFRPGCDRQAYWDTRARLLDLLRPNRNGPLTLTLRQPDGALRTINVRADPGPIFPPGDSNNWQVQEPVTFVAFDPIWSDADAVTLTGALREEDQLVFPIEFPIWFGYENVFDLADIVYQGNWNSDTVIELTGAYTRAVIFHEQTETFIFMGVPIGDGEQRVIDLRAGRQSIRDGSGGNRFGELGPDSDLVSFALLPASQVDDGVQTIRVAMFAPGPNAGAQLTYTTRYWAL